VKELSGFSKNEEQPTKQFIQATNPTTSGFQTKEAPNVTLNG